MFTKYCKQCGVELSTDEIMHCDRCDGTKHVKVLYPGKIIKPIDIRGQAPPYSKPNLRKQGKPIDMRIKLDDVELEDDLD